MEMESSWDQRSVGLKAQRLRAGQGAVEEQADERQKLATREWWFWAREGGPSQSSSSNNLQLKGKLETAVNGPFNESNRKCLLLRCGAPLAGPERERPFCLLSTKKHSFPQFPLQQPGRIPTLQPEEVPLKRNCTLRWTWAL